MSAHNPPAERFWVRAKLLGLVAFFAAPIVLAILFHEFWRPDRSVNYGEIVLPVASVSGVSLQNADGSALPMKRFDSKWVLVQSAQWPCDASCREKLFLLRQTRLALGKNRDRLERLLVFTAAPAAIPGELDADYAGTHYAFATQSHKFIDLASLYLIDPMGNIALRYPAAPEPKRLIKDLERLMKWSSAG